MFPFDGQSSGGLCSGNDSKFASCGTLQYARTRSADTIWFSTYIPRYVRVVHGVGKGSHGITDEQTNP